MAKRQHLTLLGRELIESGILRGRSFRETADILGKDPTTISKEVRRHRTVSKPQHHNPCDNLACGKCHHYNDICSQCHYDCRHQCSSCTYVKCFKRCRDYNPEPCWRLMRPPYVCNGCSQLKRCRREKYFYNAKKAQHEYETTLHENRKGCALSYEEIKRLDAIISPLVKQGQSIHHICQNNADLIMCDEKSIYNYIDEGILSVANIDLPRKTRYRVRKKKRSVRVDKKCHIGRTYDDFLEFMSSNPDTAVVEMDSVVGKTSGKVLLTIYFRNCEFMLAFIRDANTARSVTNIFNHIYRILGREKFKLLFPVILTDRGSEFTDPAAIENDENGEMRTKIFYCDPMRSDQKGGCEVNHEMIRRVLPKGRSFNDLGQDDIDLMMSHINSYTRKKLGNQSPNRLFSSLYGDDLLNVLKIQQISPNNINLTPKLLKK